MSESTIYDRFEPDNGNGVINVARKDGMMLPRYLSPAERHPSEIDSFGQCPLDTWQAARPVKFEIHVCGPVAQPHRGGMARQWSPPVKRKIELKEGERVQVPAIYRSAIQRVSPIMGVIDGGLCPYGLRRVLDDGGTAPTKLHPAIDPSVAPRVAPTATPDEGRAARLLARAAKVPS